MPRQELCIPTVVAITGNAIGGGVAVCFAEQSGAEGHCLTGLVLAYPSRDHSGSCFSRPSPPPPQAVQADVSTSACLWLVAVDSDAQVVEQHRAGACAERHGSIWKH